LTAEDMPVGSRPPAVTSWNADYVEDLYEQWQRDPSLLPESWRFFFQGFDLATSPRAFVAGDLPVRGGIFKEVLLEGIVVTPKISGGCQSSTGSQC
jgi:2-oxoglutarate dehydrogenase complex dehydrogenase (E1) component-like enzyme